MAWPKPNFSRNQVNKAGNLLIKGPTEANLEWCMDVLNNWRSCHGYPINTFQKTLRDKLKVIDPQALVAQRLKRTPSIVAKLIRFKTMELARMQDIGGLRAVVASIKEVREVQKSYRNNHSSFKHELIREDDYIDQPKKSGYRSIHLVYKYNNPHSKNATEYAGLLVVQIRTRLQHAWATAVETMGTFLEYALKSSEGPEKWLDFFSLTGSAIAHLENTSPVPGYEKLTKKDTFLSVEQAANDLDVRHRLRAFSLAANTISAETKSAAYYLVVLDLKEKSVRIHPFGRDRLEEANLEYTNTERKITDGAAMQAVLVSTGPIATLRRAYPNFFLDTHEFVHQLDVMKDWK